jgi:SAM-dependent methyltransferase
LASDTAFYELRARQKYPTSDNPEMLAFLSRVADWCRVKPGDRVLDFGCFDGWLLRKLRERHAIEGTGLDISRQALTLARKLDRSGALTFVHSDGTSLPFETESFDVVVCSEILEHVSDLDAVMAELVRILARGGTLYATMPNALEHVFPPLRGTCRVVDRVEGHVRRLTRREFVSVLRRHGLEPVKVQYRGFVLSAIWYRIFIYSPRVNRRAIGLVTSRQGLVSSVARKVAFALMRLSLAFDHRFASYRGSMGIEAVARKT